LRREEDDDEEDDEDHDGDSDSKKPDAGEQNPVKPESAEEQKSENGLKVYQDEELARFKRRELVADVELLDGLLLK
jgi:structural maintenance of chromosome 4